MSTLLAVSGALSLELGLRGGQVVDATVRSTRLVNATQVLHGLPVGDAVARVGSLFSICAVAHRCAALEACERALGVEADAPRRRARQLMVSLEALDNHLFQVCVEWANALGAAPELAPLKRVRWATQVIRGTWPALEGWSSLATQRAPASTTVGPPAASLLGPLVSAVDAVVGPQVEAPLAWQPWAQRAEGPAAALLRALAAESPSGVAPPSVPLLPQLDAPWYEARLGQPGFAQAPTFEGRPAEAGAVALTAAHPATAAQLERGGTTTLARLLAKLVHVRVLLARVASLLGEAQHPASPPEAVALPPGVGVGLAETSRGRLVHRVELSAGAVTRWAALAPTEWTFHPRGAVAQALLGAPVLDLRARAARLLAACDACVPCAVHLEERADA